MSQNIMTCEQGVPKEISRHFANLGRLGGKSRSRAKVRAVRMNGRLGGRRKQGAVQAGGAS